MAKNNYSKLIEKIEALENEHNAKITQLESNIKKQQERLAKLKDDVVMAGMGSDPDVYVRSKNTYNDCASLIEFYEGKLKTLKEAGPYGDQTGKLSEELKKAMDAIEAETCKEVLPMFFKINGICEDAEAKFKLLSGYRNTMLVKLHPETVNYATPENPIDIFWIERAINPQDYGFNSRCQKYGIKPTDTK